jgi:glyoxylase-like metal-dependent hydrolase (beta-lactamase superfamily II)
MKRLWPLILFFTLTTTDAQDFDKVEIKHIKVRKQITMLMGKGGNIGVFVGKDGVFLIDDQYAPLSKKIRAAVKKISKKPIRYVFNTHWHSDHTGGNESLGKTGSVIVAHKNVRKRLTKKQFLKAFNLTYGPLPEVALPVITFTKEMSFHINGDEVQIHHFGPGHTDGDGVLFFKKANVIHTGDYVFNGIYPFIDVHAHGSIDGMISGIEKILRLSNSKTKFIPGHGPLASQTDIGNYLSMLKGVRANIKKLMKQKKSLEEIIQAKPTAKYDAEWADGFLSPEKFIEIVYSSLKP